MTRIITITLYLSLTLSLATAQPAPDFTVTNSHGETVSLYTDYLDQGKVMLLEIMFIDCPPCNAIAPLMEPLYQQWGGGNGDVEFMSITTRAQDSNAEMLVWENGHGLTYAGVGHDGGAPSAREPYTDGTYGQFTGTPTFVVIAPDGTVEYNVIGQGGNASTIDSISAAIQRALDGNSNGQAGYSFSGTVKDLNDVPVQGVTFHLYDQSEDVEIDLMESTDATGQYSFSIDTFPIDDGDALRLKKDAPDVASVTAFDMALIQRHILDFQDLPDRPSEIKADVTRDFTINILDIVEVRKLILGINDTWTNTPAVRFATANPVSLPGGNTQVEYADHLPLDTNVGIYEVDFLILKMGDVNNSYVFD